MSDDYHVIQRLYANACDEAVGIYRRNAWAVVLGLTPQLDGNKWSLLWGSNIQEGICAFGDTPEAVILAFESAMVEKTPLLRKAEHEALAAKAEESK